jgi:NADPH-dependent curcumin reductase CurA
VALCGAVAGYDRAGPGSSEASGRETSEASGRDAPGNLFQATANELTLRGFRGSSYVGLLAEMQREVARWLREGALRYSETVVAGLERAPEALARLLAGETIGKTLVRVAA